MRILDEPREIGGIEKLPGPIGEFSVTVTGLHQQRSGALQ
jgi:hypothetical protein